MILSLAERQSRIIKELMQHGLFKFLLGYYNFNFKAMSQLYFLCREFDREKKSEYSFEVYATDSGLYGPRTTSVRVDIDISDVNDNAPIFDEIPFRADIAQNHGVRQYVTQVRADKNLQRK